MRPKVIHYGKWQPDTSWAKIWQESAGLRFQIYEDERGYSILVLATAYYEAPIHKQIRDAVLALKPTWTFKGCGYVTIGSMYYGSDRTENHVSDFRPSDQDEADRLLTQAVECLATLGINLEKA